MFVSPYRACISIHIIKTFTVCICLCKCTASIRTILNHKPIIVVTCCNGCFLSIMRLPFRPAAGPLRILSRIFLRGGTLSVAGIWHGTSRYMHAAMMCWHFLPPFFCDATHVHLALVPQCVTVSSYKITVLTSSYIYFIKPIVRIKSVARGNLVIGNHLHIRAITLMLSSYLHYVRVIGC